MAETVVITPPGRFSVPHWRELWNAREILFQFGMRDVLLRYRQTAVGVAWVVVQPLAAAAVFSVVFGRVAGLSSAGVPYFLFTYMGMLAWTLFSTALSRSAASVVGSQALIQKVFFPRLIVPAASVLSSVVDFVVGLLFGLVLLVVYGVNPGFQVLLAPVVALLFLMFGLGIGTAASAVMVRYRDVAYVLPWLIQVLLFASPVAYALDAVPSSLKLWFEANPLTWYLELFRYTLLRQPAPPAWQFVGAAVLAPLVLAGGVLVFQQFERRFADIV
ncbi:ABC transporter permease [Luteimicrobium subarcticum]|uniref:Transport permease protein n=1 Tax=Luteimicrobium subarcticum TaxID=620910 RepID=A0A2M8WT40_9MICO|nr:ABC transporter permease [Luteimicrobium subarcticum]PJI94115.1 lipopolysaccharide transport system permease protein [Luteimicrobium subarcticum]